MKKIAIFFLCFLLFIGFCVYPAAADAPNSGLDADSAVISGQVVTNVTAAIVYEMNSDTIMAAQNADAKMYPASLVKVMTALLAVENKNLDGVATVTREALAAATASTSVGLQAGEQLTVRELMYCMLTGSGNDAAAVIAVHIGGSIDSFVSMMNSRASELGCDSTNFVDPHGISSKNQYTTARDMARIFAAAAGHADFREIFGAVRHTVPATAYSPARELKTANYMMDTGSQSYYDSRVTGGRTGVAADRSRCLGVIAESGNMNAIAIVFGAKSKYGADNYTVERYGGYEEIGKLLDATISHYRIAQVFYEDQILAQRPVAGGDNDLVLVPSGMQSAIVPNNIDISDIEYRFSDAGRVYTAPIEQGTKQGTVEVWYGGKRLASADLLARNSVSVATSKMISLPIAPQYGAVLIIAAIIAVLAALAFVIHRRNVQIRKRQAERRRASGRRK